MVEIPLLIIAITELAKKYIPKELAPLIAVGLGLTYGLYMDLSVEGAIMGLALGLGTTGLYRAADKIINNK